MTEMTYFDGLNFPCFGINRQSSSATDAYPLFYGLQYIHSGNFYLSVNGGRMYHLEGPLVFLTAPDAVYRYGSPPDSCREHYFVCFEGERVRDFLQKGLFVPPAQQEIPYIKPARPEAFLAEILELILTLQSEENLDLAVARLECLLLQLHKQEQSELFCGAHYSQLEKIVQKIMLTPEKEWNFAVEAAGMNITLKHFRRIFQHFCGMPPLQFVLHQRILKACTMLVMELDTIKSIAYKCGFNNEFYFSRLFKKYMKVSPEIYRNKHPYTTGTFLKNRSSAT